MKTSLERTVEFERDQFDTLHSVECDGSHVSFDLWLTVDKRHTVSLTWDEWNALAKEVLNYAALKSQSEAA